MGLNTKLVWVYIGIGVTANLITGLLKPLLKVLWARMNKPAPLTLKDKVQLAEQIEMQKRYMERLNHLAANPKDLYLYLFQLALVVFLCISAAECLFIWGLIWGLKEAIVGVLVLFVFALALSIVALVEAKRLSAKNIERTKATVQKSIDDATSKLNLPLP